MSESVRPEELVKKTNRRFAELRRERPDEIQAFGDYLIVDTRKGRDHPEPSYAPAGTPRRPADAGAIRDQGCDAGGDYPAARRG